jgi:glycerate kinase
MTRVLVAPDKFKGSLSAGEVAAAISTGLRRALPAAELIQHPIADGGEGTVDVLLAQGFTLATCLVRPPIGGQAVAARYAVRGDQSVLEVAEGIGLARLPGAPSSTTARAASTYAVGELVLDAVRNGARRIIIGIGGSATTDGGAGALQALGAVVLDRRGRVVAPGGAALRDAAELRLDGALEAVRGVELVVACDVDNPLLGATGAAAVYAPQKGAAPSDVLDLENSLSRWAALVAETTGTDRSGHAGMGAAGGLGYGLAALGARLESGIDLLLELTGFHDRLAEADWVIVGEGSLDGQSLYGKGPVGIARRASRAGVPVIAVAGRCTLTPGQLRAVGVATSHSLADLQPDADLCMRHAAPLLQQIGEQIGSDWS